MPLSSLENISLTFNANFGSITEHSDFFPNNAAFDFNRLDFIYINTYIYIPFLQSS